MDDSIVIHQILSRNRRALSWFYRTYVPSLRRFVASKITHPQDAEEVLQDTLFAFLEGLRDFQGKSSIKTFLYAICNHKIIDHYRKKKIASMVFSRMPQLEMLISPLREPEEVFEETLIKEKIRNVLARMMPLYRQILVLKYMEDISVGDIARKLSISFKSAESRLFRARKAFVDTFLSL